MKNTLEKSRKILKIKNMCCDRCIMTVTDVLKGLGLFVESVKLGEAIYSELITIGGDYDNLVKKELKEKGFEILVDKNERVVEQIKIVIIELINELQLRENRNFNLRNFLEEKLKTNYRTLKTIFVAYKKTSIEKYFILQRIEKVKELIEEDECNFTEIADMMGYKATQHLSGQFKRITGLTMIQYKNSNKKYRKFIDEI